MSGDSDLGGDFKDGSLSWRRPSGSVYSLGFRAASPPVVENREGLRQQKDTFRIYAAASHRRAISPGVHVGYDIEAGYINGVAVDLVRNSIDSVHKWGGVAESRHSPLTSGGKVLLQGTGSIGVLLGKAEMYGTEVSWASVFSVSVGTSHVTGVAGLVAWLSHAGGRNPLPNARMPGVADHPVGYPGGFIGAFVQSTAYDIETEYAQRKPLFTYASAGWTIPLGGQAWAKVELSKDMAKRLSNQLVSAYPYASVQLGICF